MVKAYIACHSELSRRFLLASCRKMALELICSGESGWQSELRALQPELLFLDESVAGAGDCGLIDELRSDSALEHTQIIYTATSTGLAPIARKLGADAFLPIPFSSMKFDAILRSVVNLPKKILIVCAPAEPPADLQEALVKLGFDLQICGSGEEGMQLIHKIFPDLVVSSFQLPDMDGAQFCRKIKSAPLAGDIPVVALFKGNRADIIEDCFNAGMQDLLLAPFAKTENLDRITDLISPPVRGRKEKALVIDDSAMVRGLITGMFKKLGFQVSAAENGLEGLKAARRIQPDIITCDYDMPVMNGWDFCIEARQDESLEIPIIMVSARGTEVDKKKGKVLGVVEYLAKPFREPELKQAVARAIADNKRRKEREAISKYIASDVLTNVSDVIDGVKNMEPEEKQITVLFSDICSFTPKCERLNPRAVVKLLNSYFDVMIKVLQSHEGIIDKLIGDAIVARFNSGDQELDAWHAVTSAVEMLKKLVEFNLDSLEPVEIRIGINTGHLILGNIGCASFRLDYTMIGDTVNIGQRLESQAMKMGCLISASTYALVRERVVVGPGQELSLKGKERVVEAYPLLDIKS